MSKKLLGNLMKQAQMMQEKLAKAQEEAALKTIEASSGGGMVTVTVNGKMEVLSIKIEKEAVDPADVVPETNETNNVRATPLTVVPPV